MTTSKRAKVSGKKHWIFFNGDVYEKPNKFVKKIEHHRILSYLFDVGAKFSYVDVDFFSEHSEQECLEYIDKDDPKIPVMEKDYSHHHFWIPYKFVLSGFEITIKEVICGKCKETKEIKEQIQQ